MTQFELGEFTDNGDGGDRPASAEAEAIAGAGDSTESPRVETGDVLFHDVEETVEMAVVQVDYTIEGSGDDEYPVIHVFGRTADRELLHARVLEFRPYFYAPVENVTEGRLEEYPRVTGWEEFDDDGEPYESIRGQRLVKIFGQTPRDVGQIRDEFDHFEADILFPNRFLIDTDVTSGVELPAREVDDSGPGPRTLRVHHEEVRPVETTVEPRVNTFDIEVDDRSGFPEEGEEPIICLTSHDSYDDQYVLWLYEPPAGRGPPASLDGYDPIQTGDVGGRDADLDIELRSFETEEAMLAAFLDYLGDTDPDLACGWNFTDFDAPYLLDRLERLDSGTDHDLNPDRLSRVDEVWRNSWQGPNVKGRVMFDLLYAYQRTKFTELDSYRLEDVGQRELGVGKERYAGDIGDLWEENPEQLLEYNLRDVELCVELDRDQEIIAFWNEVRQFVGCKLEDATTPGDAVDMYVLHKLHDNFALPSKGSQEGEEYEGGAVFDPITGVRENVSVLDLKCFSEDTDLLAPGGARSITDVEVGDLVYTLNPETFECEIKPIEATHEYDNRFGELHHLSGNTHDFKITENHRFLVSKTRGWDDQRPTDFEFQEYRNITEAERFAFPQHQSMSGRRPETFRLIDDVETGYVVVYCENDLRWFRNRMPDAVADSLTLVHGSAATIGVQKKVGKYLLPVPVYREHRDVLEQHADHLFLTYDRQHRETPLAFEMTDWLAFLGWFVTEGSTNRDGRMVTIHQREGQDRQTICNLLDRMELTYSTDDSGVNISDGHLVDWLEANCGEGYASKRLPDWVFDLDGELLSILLDTMIRGDGSRADSGLGEFWTKSDHLKDDVVDLAVRCGQKPTVSEQSDGTWYVSIGKRGSFEKSTNATVEDHDGTVHCVTAEDNHVVLAGRNGHFQWVGQSLYPMCMVTINASPETKVDPETYPGDMYQAPNGTRFRKEPDGVIREMVDELLAEREEKKSLRNEHDPSENAYEQYDRQQQAVKVIMNCFTPDTEVLTPKGVRGIRELDVGDEVYSLDPETMEMEVKPVAETHAYPEYNGELVDIQTGTIDFRVTPNHRMLVRENGQNGTTEDGWSFVEAGNLDETTNYELPQDWDGPGGTELETVDLPDYVDEYEVWNRPDIHQGSGRKCHPRQYNGGDFLELLARYITEGSVCTAETRESADQLQESVTTVQIAQGSTAVADGGADSHASVGQLLDRLGIDYSVDDGFYQFRSRLLGELLEEICGANSGEKQIPEFVYDVSTEQKRRFLDTLIEGNVDRQPDSWRYTTSSKQLRDDLLRLCTHLGLTANYSKRSGSWRVSCTEDDTNTVRMHRSGSRSTADDGVYCVTVADNNTLVAGRNGKFQNVSNSLYGVLGWDRFRLYDREMGAAVTATGRDVIEFTEEVTSDLDKQVIYGDSVTGNRPVVVRDPDGTVRVLPIEELFDVGQQIDTTDEANSADVGAVQQTSQEYARLEGWEALSLSDEMSAEWQPIERAIRHDTEKDVVTLQHKFGESKTTRDHSYVVEQDGELTQARPDDVDTPLRIPSIPPVDTCETIDLYDVLNGYTRAYEDGRSVGTENASTKTERIHTDGETVWFGHEQHRGQDRTVALQRHVDIESEDGHALIRLLAAYVSEGSSATVETTASRFGASISEERRSWLEQLQDDYHRLFENSNASVIESDTRNDRTIEYETEVGTAQATYNDRTHKLQMMNELAAVFFTEFAGQRSRGKRIPSFVFHLPEPEQQLFLTMLVEGDGSREFPRYSEEYAEQNFDFETTSRELAAGLGMLLIQRNRKYSLKYRDEKDSYTIRTCNYYRGGRDAVRSTSAHDGYVYDLSVDNNDNFVDGIGGIVLHNTDSVMVELGSGISRENAIEESFELEDAINDSYDEFALEELNAAQHRFEIEFEKLYRRFFQAGKKKRYAGHSVWKEGKEVDDIDITGFEYKRSDIAPITKEVQLEVIQMIVTGEDVEEIKSHVHEVIQEFQEGNADPAEVGIPGGIGKRLDNYDTDTAQVRGAKYANMLLGTNFQRGSKPKRLYLDRVHADFFDTVEAEHGLDPAEDPLYGEFRRDPDVICFGYADQLPEEFEVDWEKMLDKTLKGPIARILEALDISWEEVKSGQDQTGLGEFM